MDSQFIANNMNSYLHSAASVLSGWLLEKLPLTGNIWWDECVMCNLSFNQREVAQRNGYTQLKDFDLTALLRIADRSWYTLCDVINLSSIDRECIRRLISVCNNWAHCGVDLPGKEIILNDIESLSTFFRQYKHEELADELAAFNRQVSLQVTEV